MVISSLPKKEAELGDMEGDLAWSGGLKKGDYQATWAWQYY
jgi:hypothetical protein